MGCQACGYCCTYIALEVSDYAAPWLEIHGIPLVDEGGKKKVIFDAVCKYQDPDTMLCTIHEQDRPAICGDYLCDKARGLTMDIRQELLKRKAELQQTFARLESDLNATAGALQQIDWTLAELDKPEGEVVDGSPSDN
jgi:Fe-S-cluster containining protein